jgi:cell division protein FtsW
MKRLALITFFDAFLLMLLGLVIVMSASSTYSAFKFDSLFHLFNSHFSKVLIGFGFLIACCIIPYRFYRKISKPLIILITLLLFLTLIFAATIKGAGRWLDLGFISFQPADAARLILIIHLAALIESKGDLIKNYKNGFAYYFFWIALLAFFILLQPNVSSAVLLVLIGLTMLFVGGAKVKHILITLASCLVVGLGAVMIFPHSRERIFSFIESIQNGGDVNIQVKQAVLSLGSGGIFGVGIGYSRQSNLFLPEAYGDFIFAILGEELGFIGAVIILLSYLTLFVAGILIAKKTIDKFGQMLAFGITFSIILYAFINVAVTTGMLPTTGLPLPFISYGGTSIIFLSVSIGILINIALSNAARENTAVEMINENKKQI